MKVRNLVLSLHSRLGIFVGLILVFVCLTGSLLVFHEALDRATSPAPTAVVAEGEPLSINRIFETIQQIDPVNQLSSIDFPEDDSHPYRVNWVTPQEDFVAAYINPYTGVTMGLWHYGRTLTGVLLKLHTSLFAGEIGEATVGLSAVVLLILSITGVVLWSGWRKLRIGLKVRWQAPWKVMSFDLHKVGGILSATFLSLIAFTGAVIVLAHFSPAFAALFIEPQPEPTLAELIPNQKPLPLSALVQVSDIEMRGSKPTSILFSGEDNRKVTVSRKFPDDIFIGSFVEFDRYTGDILNANKIDNSSGSTRFINFVIQFHFGTFAGVYSQVLYFFVGLTFVLLAVTGDTLFRKRRWIQARKEAYLKLKQQKSTASN